MIRMFQNAIFISLLLGRAILSGGADFHISPNGNDLAAGSELQPFASFERTLKEVRTVLKNNSNEKITVWMHGGVYRLSTPLELNVKELGEIGGGIFFKAMPDEEVIISGGKTVTGWIKNDLGNWEAQLPSGWGENFNFRELFIGDSRAIRARFPNKNFIRVKKAGTDRRTNFFFEKGDFPIPENSANVELVLLHDWSISRIRLKEINLNENKLIAVDSIGAKNPAFFNLDNWEPNPRYFLENDIAFLDEENEWYYNSIERKITLKLPENVNPEQIPVTIPVSQGLIRLIGFENHPVKNISFEGIQFRHAAWEIPTTGYCGVQACHYDPRPLTKGWAVLPAALFADWAENCSLTRCKISNIGCSGVWFKTGCKNCKVDNSEIFDISGNGIMIGEGQDREINGQQWWQVAKEQVASNNRIENCFISECGQQFYGAVGIWCGLTARTTIYKNEVCNLPYSGISVGWMWSPVPTPCRENIIDENHIHHIMNVLSDGGGIYMLGLQPGSRLVNNWIHDVEINAGRAESNGMFLDEGTTDVLIANNLIHNIEKSPLRFHKATINLVKNNHLFCSGDNPPIRYNNTSEKDIRMEDNLIFSENDKNYGRELNARIKLRRENKY